MLKTFRPNLVSQLCVSLQILDKIWRGNFRSTNFWSNPFIALTPEPIMILTWNLTIENSKVKKKLKATSCWQIMVSSSLFQLMFNLEQSRTHIPNKWSIIFKFSLIVVFFLAKTESRTERSLGQLSFISLSKASIFAKNNNADINKNKGVLVLKDKFSKIPYLHVLTCQITSF